MKFYWGHKKRGVLSAKGFVQDNSGRLFLKSDRLSVFRFYGIMWGARFFGFITKDDK